MAGGPQGGSLAGTTALVTGASRGIGRATALRLLSLGVRVGLVARSRDVLEETAREAGGWALPCDVTRRHEVDRMAEAFRERAGAPPDLVVGAAGVFSLGSVDTLAPEALERNLEVNLKGAILVVRALLPGMRERGRGTLVQIGSVAGRKAFPGNGAYSASKFGLRGFHEVLLEELRGSGLRATLLEPAATDTSIWDPLDPDGDPALPDRAGMLRVEEVAEAILFVASRPLGVQVPFLPLERVRAPASGRERSTNRKRESGCIR